MRHEELQQLVKRHREAYELAVSGTDVAIGEVCPPTMLREVTQARKSEADALKLLVLAELFAGFQEDPDALAAWMAECVEAGEIIKGSAGEDDW